MSQLFVDRVRADHDTPDWFVCTEQIIVDDRQFDHGVGQHASTQVEDQGFVPHRARAVSNRRRLLFLRLLPAGAGQRHLDERVWKRHTVTVT